MNNKLLISVSLPILDISFDLEVPNIIKVGSLKNIILDYVRNNYNNDMEEEEELIEETQKRKKHKGKRFK